MAELPEITIIARQMDDTLKGKTIVSTRIKQPKCLNLNEKEFKNRIIPLTIKTVKPRGKWIFIYPPRGKYVLLLNTGMGADIVYVPRVEETGNLRYQFLFCLDDNSGFMVKFWWFGYVYVAKHHQVNAVIGNHGPTPLDPEFTLKYYLALLDKRRNMGIKNFLLNQKIIAGIGNVYVQDILYLAKLHPLTRIKNIGTNKRKNLYHAMKEVLLNSINRGISSYEKDFFGKKGDWSIESMLVGYREGKPCPGCGSTIVKIKTGSTSSYICPSCQRA